MIDFTYYKLKGWKLYKVFGDSGNPYYFLHNPHNGIVINKLGITFDNERRCLESDSRLIEPEFSEIPENILGMLESIK
jgi:hypothetical protein